ncbi:ATP-dependent helicase, partial [Fischerella thermalis WC542]
MPQPIHVNKNNLYTFSRLAPFIQEYIYNHNWTELRPVQIAACQVIFDTDAHLLIAAATAAGKTEAAFLPILTLLHENPSSTIGALYIGPIKALINDQFERLHGLLKEADIPVWHWHGDVSQSHKNQLLKNPLGILQITPESLESLLINKYHDIKRLFGDLRF